MASNETPLEFQQRVARRLGRLARREARKALVQMARDSRRAQALRESMEVEVETRGSGRNARVEAHVTVPFYWAVYYHDGRGPIEGSKRSLVFFKRITDDPRVGGTNLNYPKRASDIRRLSKSEFNRARREGKLVVTDRVGPAPAHPFFEKSLRNFSRQAGPVVREEFSRYVRNCLRADGLLRVSKTITI